MKMTTRIMIAICFLIFISCDKENSNPSDEFTLKSTGSTGFSFEKLEIINFPNSNNLKPDFFVSPQINENGDVVSSFFAQPDLENRFYLSGEFENYENALDNYESHIIPDDIHYLQFALFVKPNQIWLILTNDERCGLVLIKSTEHNNNNDTPYAEVTFKAKMLSQD